MSHTAFTYGVYFKELLEEADYFPNKAHKAVLVAIAGAICNGNAFTATVTQTVAVGISVTESGYGAFFVMVTVDTVLVKGSFKRFFMPFSFF